MSRKRREKKRAKSEENFKEQLYLFLKDYGNLEPAQEATEADIDTQIRSITTLIAHKVNDTTEGTIIDIGCGKGIILARLSSISAFTDQVGWNYIGTDYQERLSDILHLSINLGIHKKVDAISLDLFYTKWPIKSKYPGPYIIIVRNVFHELNIESTSRLLLHIVTNMGADDTIIIQDFCVFPKAEKANVCWVPHLFAELLRECGLKPNLTEEITQRGNRFINIIATLGSVSPLSLDVISDKVVKFRTRQLYDWKALGGLHPDDTLFRDVRFAKIDFDLQVAALILQLQEVGIKIPSLTNIEDNLIQQETFEKCLYDFEPKSLANFKILAEGPKHFRDRGNSLDALVDFMSGDFRITSITGPPLMGKTELMRHFLFGEAFKHNRLPILIDVQATSSVWNIIEQIFSAINCKIPSEVLQKLRRISLSNINQLLLDLMNRISDTIIIVFDHFENFMEPSGEIFDPDIRNLLIILVHHDKIKITITSRREIELSFMPQAVIYPKPQPPVGRFPRGEHVNNVLQSFLLYGKYPDKLIDAIDRHPFLATLTGMYLQRYGEGALKDDGFIGEVKSKLRNEIFAKIICGVASYAIEALSQVRIPIPRKMVVKLSSEESVSQAEKLGVIVHEVSRGQELLRCIGALRIALTTDSANEVEEQNITEPSDRVAEIEFHKRIIKCYEQLYREDDDPKYLREMHYHQIIVGDTNLFNTFGTYYRSELFAAGVYWYDREKDFVKALWAYNIAQSFGQRGYYIRMRIASCKVRLGNSKENQGEKEFELLIEEYPNEIGIKTSYVDAKIYRRKYDKALSILQKYDLIESDSSWIAGQFGRAYSGLHEHKKAINSFEYQRREDPNPIVYELIAREYNRLGDTGMERQVLEEGLKSYPNSKRLLIYKGALLERIGSFADSIEILSNIIENDPFNGWVILPLIRALGKFDRLEEAIQIVGRSHDNIRPEFLKTTVTAEILVRREKYEKAISIIDLVREDEHNIWLKLEIYLSWANKTLDEEERKNIALKGIQSGLQYPIILHDIPVLIILSRLALIAEDKDSCDEFINYLKIINPHHYELERIIEEYADIWPQNNNHKK